MISTENNASALAALLTFKQSLTVMGDPEGLLPDINTMIYGPGGSGAAPTSPSILYFMRNYAWDSTNQIFAQGITETYDSSAHMTPTSNYGGVYAVDANTWGVTALTPELVDNWFGARTSYQIWQHVKKWAGYYSSGTLMGVGYSSADGNGPGQTGGIMSAEWTFGAINFVRSLIHYYGCADPDLTTDESEMVAGVALLHSDNFATAPQFAATGDITTGRPANYSAYVPTSSGNSGSWFVYASKRYFIPFGWFANPLPSLTSTSWAVMVQYGWNPLSPTGDYTSWWK
jgi:hypothetical protein